MPLSDVAAPGLPSILKGPTYGISAAVQPLLVKAYLWSLEWDPSDILEST